MIGIYKITNLINSLCYIGQSVHIERRFLEHKGFKKASLISKAIKEYGEKNFSFEVIEECEEDKLNEREQYWIKYYNSITPNGYNILESINSIHTNYHYFNKDTIISITEDLKKSSLNLVEIAKKYNTTVGTISRINSGQTHYQIDTTYPIRKTNHKPREEKYCQICGKKISYEATTCKQCAGKKRMIPLEKMPITREELKNLIRTIPFTQIGKKFNVTDNSIRKWCDKYNLPRKKKDINAYSDEEWDLI